MFRDGHNAGVVGLHYTVTNRRPLETGGPRPPSSKQTINPVISKAQTNVDDLAAQLWAMWMPRLPEAYRAVLRLVGRAREWRR